VLEDNLWEGNVEVKVGIVEEDIGGPFATSTRKRKKSSRAKEAVEEDYELLDDEDGGLRNYENVQPNINDIGQSDNEWESKDLDNSEESETSSSLLVD